MNQSKYIIWLWILTVIMTPLIYFGAMYLFMDSDNDQYLNGDYWLIVFFIVYIMRGAIISLPLIILDYFTIKKLFNAYVKLTKIKFIIVGLNVVVIAFVLLISEVNVMLFLCYIFVHIAIGLWMKLKIVNVEIKNRVNN